MPARIDEKWLQEHPRAAEMIRQAEAKQNPMETLPAGDDTQELPVITQEMIRQVEAQKAAPGASGSSEKEQGNMIYPAQTAASARGANSDSRPAMIVVAVLVAVLLVAAVCALAQNFVPPRQASKAPAIVAQVRPVQAVTQPQQAQVQSSPHTQVTQTVQPPAAGTAAQVQSQAQPGQTAHQPAVSQYFLDTPLEAGIPFDVFSDPNTLGQSPSGKEKAMVARTNDSGVSVYDVEFVGPANEAYQIRDALNNLPNSVEFLSGSRPPIIGQMAGDNDLPVTLEVSGPNGTKTIQGKIDSGTQLTEFPASFLQSLGYSPESTQTVEGVTGSSPEGVYDVPYIQIKGNNGQWETLYEGTLQVWGAQFDEALVGADVLKNCSLQVNGSTFVLGLTD